MHGFTSELSEVPVCKLHVCCEPTLIEMDVSDLPVHTEMLVHKSNDVLLGHAGSRVTCCRLRIQQDVCHTEGITVFAKRANPFIVVFVSRVSRAAENIAQIVINQKI